MRRVTPALLVTLGAGADPDTHYADLPVGERGAAMGGAFTALADEATGMHYNPAGPALFDHDTLNLAMAAYRYRRTAADNVSRICDQEIDIDQSSFFTFPGAFGLVKRLGTATPQALGFTVIVPDNLIARQIQTVEDIDCANPAPPPERVAFDLASSVSQSDRTLWFGLGWAARPTRWLAVGAGPVVVLRTLHFDQTTIARVEGLGGTNEFQQLDGAIWNAAGQAGVLLLHGSLRAGLAARSPTVELAQTARIVEASLTGDPTVDYIVEIDGEDIDLRYPLPARFALGLAWTVPRRFTVSADATYHLPLDPYAPFTIDGADDASLRKNRRVAVLNAAVGAEWWAKPSLDLMAGFFTNRSSYPRLRVNRPDPRDNRTDFPHIDYYGLTLGGSWVDKRATLTLVVQTMVGVGEMAGFVIEDAASEMRQRKVDVRDLVLTALLGGSFDL